MNTISNNSRVRLADFNGSRGYDREAGRVKELCWYLTKMCFFLTTFPFPYRFKAWLLRLYGAKTGKGLIIKPRVNIHMPWKLSIGDNVWIGEEVFILNFEHCTIGNNVCISQRAFLCGGNHDYRDPSMAYRNGPITLEDGSWVGAGCFVGPGVEVGVDTVISAGSVLTKSAAHNSIYRGNPAQRVGNRWKEAPLK
ncbi:MAG: WcaF family extracellular polysaccharide biosynthesis acetyltransferase [Chitinophagaceae bacterium]|nr:WcaF family extracellular polysaccharide biosynthesis acetyltransferase [Chitinophagaceae bacterium]